MFLIPGFDHTFHGCFVARPGIAGEDQGLRGAGWGGSCVGGTGWRSRGGTSGQESAHGAGAGQFQKRSS